MNRKPLGIYPRLSKYMQEPFDPTRQFVATRTMICGGKHFLAGQLFNKNLVNTRRLRQMYEQRMLRMMPQDEPLVTQVLENMKPEKPKFEELSNEGLRLWLRNNGYIPKPRTPREKLLELVEIKWKEYFDEFNASHSDSSIDSQRVQQPSDDGNTQEGGSEQP